MQSYINHVNYSQSNIQNSGSSNLLSLCSQSTCIDNFIISNGISTIPEEMSQNSNQVVANVIVQYITFLPFIFISQSKSIANTKSHR